MMEPEWIEHNGSAVCPVPAGHDVEVRFRTARRDDERNKCPTGWRWKHYFIRGADGGENDITHYRDWTAFAKEQDAMSNDVPEWAVKQAWQKAVAVGMPDDKCIPNGPYTGPLVTAFARYIAAHEDAPVDPLRRILDEAGDECGFHISEDFVAAVRARLPGIDALARAGGGEG